MMVDNVLNLYEWLQTQSVDAGWTVIVAGENDNTDRILVLMDEGGPVPPPPATEGIGQGAVSSPTIQVRGRGEPWKRTDLMQVMLDVFNILHGTVDVDMNGTRYIGVLAQTAAPIFLGYDDKHRPEMTMTFEMKVQTGG